MYQENNEIIVHLTISGEECVAVPAACDAGYVDGNQGRRQRLRPQSIIDFRGPKANTMRAQWY